MKRNRHGRLDKRQRRRVSRNQGRVLREVAERGAKCMQEAIDNCIMNKLIEDAGLLK